MDSNTSSPYDLGTGPDETPAGLEGIAAAIGELAARDPDELGDALLAGPAGAPQQGDREHGD